MEFTESIFDNISSKQYQVRKQFYNFNNLITSVNLFNLSKQKIVNSTQKCSTLVEITSKAD